MYLAQLLGQSRVSSIWRYNICRCICHSLSDSNACLHLGILPAWVSHSSWDSHVCPVSGNITAVGVCGTVWGTVTPVSICEYRRSGYHITCGTVTCVSIWAVAALGVCRTTCGTVTLVSIWDTAALDVT